MNRLLRPLLSLVAPVVLLAASLPATAGSMVRFATNVGEFDVELYDAAMPITVARNRRMPIGQDMRIPSNAKRLR